MHQASTFEYTVYISLSLYFNSKFWSIQKIPLYCKLPQSVQNSAIWDFGYLGLRSSRTAPSGAAGGFPVRLANSALGASKNKLRINVKCTVDIQLTEKICESIFERKSVNQVLRENLWINFWEKICGLNLSTAATTLRTIKTYPYWLL